MTSNAAGVRAREVEFEAGIKPIDGLKLDFAIAYLDAKYTSWANGPCRFDNPAKAIPGCTQDRTGDHLQSSPKWTSNVGINYDTPVSDTLRASASATLNFQSDVNYQETDSPLEIQRAFSKTDMRFGIGSVKTGWELTMLIRNVFDKRTAGLIFETFPVGIGSNNRVYAPAPGRTFPLQGRIRF